MRILPLALVGRDWSPALLIGARAPRLARDARPPAVPGGLCGVLRRRAGLLAGMAPAAALAWAFAENERLYHEERDRDEAHLAALEELRAWTGRGGRGFVVDSFWSAWDAFAGATDYADAIRRAVAYGGRHGHDGRHRRRPGRRLLGLGGDPARVAPGDARARHRPAAGRRARRDDHGRRTRRPQRARSGSTSSTCAGRRSRAVAASASRSCPARSATDGPARTGGTSTSTWRGSATLGVDALFLLVEDSELDRCLVPELPDVMAADGPELVRFPIRTRRTRRSRRVPRGRRRTSSSGCAAASSSRSRVAAASTAPA